MTPLLLDTHALVWLTAGAARLGPGARRRLDEALDGDGVAVSAITFWEVAMLARRGRLALRVAAEDWRRLVLDLGIEEVPVSGPIAIRAARLEDFHGDPADRLIVATAHLAAARLVTADRSILDWPGGLECLDARR